MSVYRGLVLALHVLVSNGAILASNYSFALYKEHFGRTYVEDSEEHRLREAIFEARLADIRQHNAGSSSWKKGVNHMTDYTEDELDLLLGHKPLPKSMRNGLSPIMPSSLLEGAGFGEEDDVKSCSSAQASCMETDSACCSGLICGSAGKCETIKRLETFDWSHELKTAHEVLEQGKCGSCWAVAAAAAINMHAEKEALALGKKFDKVLSPENLLSCTPNKMECGGQGGCKGATAELAFEWLKQAGNKGGMRLMEDQGYDAKDNNCAVTANSYLRKPAPMVTIQGWKKLPDNNAEELMNALTTVGPLVVSMAAKGIHGYDSGIVDNCQHNVINHAVVMMGYSEDKDIGMPYWNIRNSWGKQWGENGFFRLQRFATKEEEPCGWDMEPAKGVACKDKEGPDGKYPDKQWVCGACAILADTAYPIGTVVPDALLETGSSTQTHRSGSSHQTHKKALTAKDQELVWCKTQCQHFAMPSLAKKYGTTFGDDPTKCTAVCDSVVA